MYSMIIFINMIDIAIALFLGVIEGITEFLPISSSAHLILIKNVLDFKDDLMQIFIVIVQLGAISAVLVIFRRKIYNMSIIYIYSLLLKKRFNNVNCLRIQHIYIGTIPGLLIGMCFYEKIKLLFFNPVYIAWGLLIGGILLLISEWYFSIAPAYHISNINDITYFQAFLIGCFQCLAFFPGFSRSGSTIGGGLLVGLNRQVSIEFSFLLAIPIMLGSTILTIWKQRIDLNINNLVFFIVGFFSALIVSLITIKSFLKIIQKISLIPFVIYRFLLAITIYYWIYNNSKLLNFL